MKLKLSYIGLNTDNPTPILITENHFAVAADKDKLQEAFNEAAEYCAALETALAEWKDN